MLSYLKSLLFSTTAQSTYITSAADIGMAGISAITTVIFARQLPPEHFGILLVVWTILTLFASILDLGIGAGIVNFVAHQADRAVRNRFISTGFWFLSVLGLLTVSLTALTAHSLQSVVFPNVPLIWIIWAAAGALLLLLAKYYNDCLRATQQFAKAATMTVTFGILRLAGVAILVLNSELTLASSVIIMCWSPIIYLVLGFWLLNLPISHYHYDHQALKKLIHFSGWLGVNQVLSTVSGRADVLLLNRLSGSINAGFYGTAGLMVKLWVILAGSLSAVVAPRLLSFGQRQHQQHFLLKIMLLALSLWIPILGIALLAKSLILLIFGSSYLSAIPALYWLSAAVAISIATIPITLPVIYLLRRPDIIGWVAIVQLVITLVGNLTLIPHWGAIAPAIVMVINQLVATAVCAWWTLRWWRHGSLSPTN